MHDIATQPPRALDERLEAIRTHSRLGAHAEALRSCADLLPEADGNPAAYECAALAFLAAIGAGHGVNDLEQGQRLRLVASMVEQADCAASPPILHLQLAGQHSSEGTSLLDRAARDLLPTLQIMLAAAKVHKNLILLILLLRHTPLGRTVGQREISRLHREWIARFTLGDLAIPYNAMFDPRSFRRNVADVSRYLREARAGVQGADDLPLSHWVAFEWLLARHLRAGDQGWLLDRATERLEQSALLPEQAAAARSLLVRHWPAGENAMKPGTSAGNASLYDIVREMAALREVLRKNASGRPILGRRLIENRAWWVTKLVMRRLPMPILRGHRKLRIAVCVSGQLRGYAGAFRSWRNTLLRDVEHDLFVDSWERIGRSGAEPFRSVLPFEGERFVNCYREVCLQRGFDEIKQRYPTLFRVLAETGRATEAGLKEFYMTPHVRLDDESMKPFAAYSNQEKMHSKIQSCFEMATATGREYDLIVRLRPDKPIRDLCFSWRELLDVCRSEPVLFADRAFGAHYAGPMIGDQFAIGTPAVMEVYCRTWVTHPRIAAEGLLKFPKTFEGHVSLAQVCWLSGVDVRRAPFRFGVLQDAERLSGAVILESLRADAEGRCDHLDVQMMEAVSKDVGQAAPSC